ncbi:ankyrin-1-like [Mytilus trossulus]|uniref:ankyrin-1-like n=1 Tax=Mytilus trossulus TaxID=6551 RepID=UPI0030052A75
MLAQSTAESSTFDVTLMICTLRNLANINIQDNLPVSTDRTDEAALSRIKFYRNEIAHNDSGTLTEKQFHQYWDEISQAIILLGGQNYTQLCADLKVCKLDGHDKEVLIELRNIRGETIPKGAIVVHNSLLEEWSTFDEKVVQTRAIKRILELLEEEDVLTVIGPPGCGKSTAIHHAALQLRDKEDYVIVPVNFPGEIIQYYNPECKQVFVCDDICGEYAIDTPMLSNWCRLSNAIQCNKDIRSYYGHTPLYFASMLGHTEVVAFLLENKSDANICSKNNTTALHAACRFDKMNFSTKPHSSFNMTPLFVASSNGNVDLVKLLLEHNANPNWGNRFNETPLYSATEKGKIEIVNMLLEFNADPNLCNNHNVSPLQAAATVKEFSEIVSLLLYNGANPHHGDNDNDPLLILATHIYSYDIIELLLKFNADPNICNGKGETCLHLASRIGAIEIVRILLENNADPNVVDYSLMKTPLYIASHALRHSVFIKSSVRRNNIVIGLEKPHIRPFQDDVSELVHQDLGKTVKLLLRYKADPLSVV